MILYQPLKKMAKISSQKKLLLSSLEQIKLKTQEYDAPHRKYL
jgi:hypothetical protein